MTPTELKRRLIVMAITDPSARLGVVETVRAAIRVGIPAVQLRWKDGSARDLAELATTIRGDTQPAGSLLIINDRLDVALAVGADGVHLGDDDLPLAAARKVTPAGFVIGRSVDTPEEAEAAEAEGADYVGLGPIFATGSKTNLGSPIGTAGVAAVRARVRVPIVGIGGVDPSSARSVTAAGADGVAVIGAIMNAADPEAAAETLLREATFGLQDREAGA